MKNKAGLKAFTSSLIAIALGLVFGFIIILIANPSIAGTAFSILLRGGFYRGLKSVGDVFYSSVPIMMTGLSVAFAFKCGLFNIGTPGQYIVGSFTALMIGLKMTFIPQPFLWILAVLGGGLAGALWALLPGLLKAYRNVNEVISSIMMNYIGMLLVIEGVKAWIYNPAGAQSHVIGAHQALPKAGLDQIFTRSNINIGSIIAIALCVIAYIILTKTTFGFELKACGFNRDASRYAGMNEKKCIVCSMLVAGFFAGVGGALYYMSGTGQAIATAQVLAAEGFNGIPVALLGFNNPLGVIASSLFISYIKLGGHYMQALNLPVEIIDVIVAAIIYFSSFSLFIRLFLEKRVAKKEKAIQGGEQ